MGKSEFKEKWQKFLKKAEPAQSTAGNVLSGTGTVLGMVFSWIYKLRSVLLAIPVAAMAIGLAVDNLKRLPETVGINLLTNGEYAMYVTRSVAVMGPLALTALCLLLMFCSRKMLYPWVISIFSLTLPWLIYITNVFPA